MYVHCVYSVHLPQCVYSVHLPQCVYSVHLPHCVVLSLNSSQATTLHPQLPCFVASPLICVNDTYTTLFTHTLSDLVTALFTHTLSDLITALFS